MLPPLELIDGVQTFAELAVRTDHPEVLPCGAGFTSSAEALTPLGGEVAAAAEKFVAKSIGNAAVRQSSDDFLDGLPLRARKHEIEPVPRPPFGHDRTDLDDLRTAECRRRKHINDLMKIDLVHRERYCHRPLQLRRAGDHAQGSAITPARSGELPVGAQSRQAR